MAIEFGVQFVNLEPQALHDLAQAAEALRFDLIVLPDHIVMEGPEKQHDPHMLAYDAITMAGVIAQATRKARIGHLVLCNLFRHPAITAQSLMTLDRLSNGRLIAGLGGGWTETEFRMTGIPFPPIAERLRMLDESLTCIRSLWTKEQTTFNGEFYRMRDAILWPKPVQKPHPPIIVGGGGKGLLRVAGRHADYVNIIPDAGKPGKISLANIKALTDSLYAEKVAFVREEAKRNGRDPGAIRISSFIFNFILTDSREATRKTAETMAPMFGMSPEAMLASPLSIIGTPEECIAEIKRRAAKWGVSQFILSGFTGLDAGQLRRVREEVLAHV